jgi:hypothetical protein
MDGNTVIKVSLKKICIKNKYKNVKHTMTTYLILSSKGSKKALRDSLMKKKVGAIRPLDVSLDHGGRIYK